MRMGSSISTNPVFVYNRSGQHIASQTIGFQVGNLDIGGKQIFFKDNRKFPKISCSETANVQCAIAEFLSLFKGIIKSDPFFVEFAELLAKNFPLRL